MAANDRMFPGSTGTRTLRDVPLAELVPFIDWSPFFATWELRGKYPQIFDDARVGTAARELFDHAQQLLADLADHGRLTAHGVYGFWPAAATACAATRTYRCSTRTAHSGLAAPCRLNQGVPAGDANEAKSAFWPAPDHTKPAQPGG